MCFCWETIVSSFQKPNMSELTTLSLLSKNSADSSHLFFRHNWCCLQKVVLLTSGNSNTSYHKLLSLHTNTFNSYFVNLFNVYLGICIHTTWNYTIFSKISPSIDYNSACWYIHRICHLFLWYLSQILWWIRSL